MKVNLIKGASQKDLNDAVDLAKLYRDETEVLKDSVSTSVSDIHTSEANALLYANNASNSATSALNSANTATTKANEASNSALSANNSATSIIDIETTILGYKNDTLTYRNETEAFKNTASSKASEASMSASNALVSANNASTSKDNALTYSNNAQTYMNNAQTSASDASNSKDSASLSASSASNSKDQALVYRNESSVYASQSLTNANNATIQANIAKDNAVTATTQAGIATIKASEANTSANQALTYKNEVMSYVIPSGASYSVDQLNTKYSAMTKAQFNALADERKANRAGSGFDNFGKGSSTTTVNVNEGIWTDATQANRFYIGKTTSNSGSSITNDAQSVVNGVLQKLQNINNGSLSIADIILPTAPTIYPSTTTLTAEQIASGVVKHADSSNSGLIVNGKFDTDTSGWSATESSLSNVAGKIRITRTTVGYPRAIQSFTTIIGKKYIVEGTYYKGTNLPFAYMYNTAIGSQIAMTSGERKQIEFTATSTTTNIELTINSGGSIGEYADFDNIAVFPADAISRSDLVFLESWHEDVSEKNFVYPLGNVQYLGSNTDGLTGIANGSFTGFDTYSLFGNWQASSALIGKGYVWSSLTETQKKSFLSNPYNNCYLDGDNVIQVRYRIRVVQGLGDNWLNTSDTVNTNLVYSSSSYNVVLAKGKLSSVNDFGNNSVSPYYAPTSYGIIANVDKSIGSFTATNFSSSSIPTIAYNDKCFALPIALVHRRNQGAYHPVYNPNGTKKISDSKFWYETTISFTNISDCFNDAKLLTASGYIISVSARPDGLFYDQVYESDILDLRNSSKKVEDYNRLINREFNKLVAGAYRGKEGEIYTATVTQKTADGTSATITYYTSQNKDLPVEGGSILHNGATARILYYSVSGATVTIVLDRQIARKNQFDLLIPLKSNRTKSNTLLHCDIIGNPANYPTSWKQSGVFGTPLLVAEDGTSLLPTGSKSAFKLSRKANATPLLCLRSTDSGATWTLFTPTFSTTTNDITLTNEPTANLVMVYYQTHTSMAVPTVNSEVLEIGDVWAGNNYLGDHGVKFIPSLINKIPIGTTKFANFYTKLTFSTVSSDGKLLTSPTHTGITEIDSASPSAKTFTYLTRTNGKAFLNLVFKEMKYNGTTWGDDNKFNIVDNISTTTDNNAQTVLIGQKTVELPFFIAGDE